MPAMTSAQNAIAFSVMSRYSQASMPGPCRSSSCCQWLVSWCRSVSSSPRCSLAPCSRVGCSAGSWPPRLCGAPFNLDGSISMGRLRMPVVLGTLTAVLAAIGWTATGSPALAAGEPWQNAAQTPQQRADELLGAMTLAEKITMMHGGAQCPWGVCVDANTRLGIPQLRLQDGPAGVADGAGGVTQLPAPVAGAATWDTGLMGQYGQVVGAEEWGKGANVVLGPTINIVRDPRWGRAFESLSEDPYLAAQLGAADIAGIQGQGPMAQVKHYADYNQETFRNTAQDNVIMSDRTQREIYLPAFEAAVQQAKAYSVMCSYATVAGTFACENAPLLKT